MDLEQFVKTYNGKKVDFDNYAGPQCVDLPRQYWKDVCGIKERLEPCTTSGGAKDLFLDYEKMPKEKKYFKKGTRGFSAGDVLIWNSSGTNKFGHVAIMLGTVGKSLIVFEQDGFKQDGAKINLRSKENLLGYLRKK